MNSSQYKQSDLKPLREKDNSQYVPEEQQIKQYASYIGVNLPEEDYMWELAKQGVMASLPPDWQACQTPDGELVYRNKKTKEVQQQHPMDEIYKQRVIDLRQAYNKYSMSQNEELNTIPEERSEQKSYHDNSELDELMMPSRQFTPTSNILKQQSNEVLNHGMVLISKEFSVGDNKQQLKSNILGNVSVERNIGVSWGENISLNSNKDRNNISEQLLCLKKQSLQAQLQHLLSEQVLANQLLLQLQLDNKRRTRQLKHKLTKKR